MPAYSHIDPAVLFHATGADPDMFRALCQTYLDTSPALYRRVELALQDGAPQAIVHGCHTLRGTVVLLGAHGLASRLSEMELLVRQQGVPPAGWLDETARLMGLVANEVKRSMAEYPGCNP